MQLFTRTVILVAIVASGLACGQPAESSPSEPDTSVSASSPPANVAPVPDKRIFGVLPNYRTAEDTGEYQRLTAKQKFRIATKDSTDWPGFLVAAGFAGLYQLENSNPDFGQGLKGYAHRYATAYGDQVIGNFMTEGMLPSVLHEDPRYFRHPSGTVKGRIAYAVSRILVTRTDSGSTRFNYSEIVGNSIATGISNLYYPESRTISDNVEKLGVQLATDAFSNVLKEFWPDIKRKWFKKAETQLAP